MVRWDGIIVKKREDWLKERQSVLGASEVAAALGLSPFVSPLQLYAQKLGLVEVEENEAMVWGRRLEEPIALGFAEDTKRPIFRPEPYTLVHHPDIPFLACTLDFENEGSIETPAPKVGKGPLEIKNPGLMQKVHWTEDPPLQYVIQTQIQMSCTRAEWGTLCALIGGSLLRFKDMLRSDEFLNAAFPKLEEFWLRVQRHDPPPASVPEDLKTTKALFPSDREGAIELSSSMVPLIERWKKARRVKTDVEKIGDKLEAELRLAIGEHDVAILPDGRKITAYQSHVMEAVRKAYDFRRLNLKEK